MREEIIGDKKVILADSERQGCEVFSRVMGYLRPVYLAETDITGKKVYLWNPGKVSEFNERVTFVEPRGLDRDKESLCSHVASTSKQAVLTETSGLSYVRA